jgi:hypothetical protein
VEAEAVAEAEKEIGLEHAPFDVLVYFFPHLNMQKSLLIMGPNNTKNSP